jgi:hypothetical protein
VKPKKFVLVIIIFLNVIVLLGQIWPAGAPPFARWVNIFFLIGNLGYFIDLWLSNKKGYG